MHNSLQKRLDGSEEGWWLICHADELWQPNGLIPHGSAAQWSLQGETAYEIGCWQQQQVYLIQGDKGEHMTGIRHLLAEDPEWFQLIGRGLQLHHFLQTHIFCSLCGAPTQLSEQREWMLQCTRCGHNFFPEVSPCVIMAVRKANQILLAQHPRHKHQMYTVLAGFVEPGETLEQAVAREVLEETGIQVRNIRYFSSQPWPFPRSLMMAFWADYHSGEIQIDPKELTDAQWVAVDDPLPELPPEGTVARQMIDQTFAMIRQEQNEAKKQRNNMNTSYSQPPSSGHMANEIEKFDHLADHWWNQSGTARALHDINPVRLEFVARNCTLMQARTLDVGCGGGILAEPLARAGAQVTGIDLSQQQLQVAREHACSSGLNIDYHCADTLIYAQDHAGEFDVITCMELLEHVPDPAAIVQACAQLLKPGGKAFFATLNRTPQSWALAIVAAERVLHLLEPGTHDHSRFIKPHELEQWCREAGLHAEQISGLQYLPFIHKAWLGGSLAVNYLMCVSKPQL